jgi:mRNA interferase MazF
MTRPRLTDGEVWDIDYGPIAHAVGHEQALRWPGLIVSVTRFNTLPFEQVVTVPFTSRPSGNPLTVLVRPPEGGLTEVSWALCYQVRSISQRRLLRRRGRVDDATLQQVVQRVCAIFGVTIGQQR